MSQGGKACYEAKLALALLNYLTRILIGGELPECDKNFRDFG